jgi:hypothetical protein
MTDPPEPLTDEYLSASLDGEATSPEGEASAPDDASARPAVDRIASDPAAAARHEQLREAARVIGRDVAPLADEVVDDLVTEALASADQDQDDNADPDPEDVAVPVRTGRRRSGPPLWSVAAALVVLVALGLSLIYRGTSGDRHGETATTASTQPATATESAASPTSSVSGSKARSKSNTTDGAATNFDAVNPDATGPQLSGSGSSPVPQAKQVAPKGPVLDLGEYASKDALRQATRKGFPKALPLRHSVQVSLAQVVRCAGLIDNSPLPVRQRITQAAATVDGTAVLVYQYKATPSSSGAPRTLIVTMGPAACDPELVFFQS